VSVPVKISSAAHWNTQQVRCNTDDPETTAAGEGCQVDVSEGSGGTVTEDHVHRPAVTSTATTVEIQSCNGDIAESIPVNITCAARALSTVITGSCPVYLEPRASGVNRQIDCAKGSRGAVPKNYVRRAGFSFALWIGSTSRDNQVICSVTVHISGTAHGHSACITSGGAEYPEAGTARGEGGQVYVRPAAGLAKDHHCSSPITARRGVVQITTNDEIPYTILVDVSCAANRISPLVISSRPQDSDGLRQYRGRRVDGTGDPASRTEHQICSAGIDFPRCPSFPGPDDDVIVSILVNVTSRSNAVP
jgi:hypothetical protein